MPSDDPPRREGPSTAYRGQPVPPRPRPLSGATQLPEPHQTLPPRQRPLSGATELPAPPSHRHAASGAIEPQERSGARTLAGALDALVRAQRLQTSTASVAVRTRDLLVATPNTQLAIGANALRVGQEVGLEADTDHGRWLLPAFMAGLRGLTPQDELRPEELQTLAAALAALRFDPDALGNFADWLWSDGLDGFEVELHAGFSEILDTAADPGAAKRQIVAMRAELAQGLANQVEVTQRDLDRAAVLPAFQVSLDTFAAGTRSGGLDLAPEQAASLRHSADAAAYWARQELTLALVHPAMRAATTPEALAKSLVKVAAEAFEEAFLPLLAALSHHADPYVKQILGALEREPVGAVIAERAPLDEAGQGRLVALLTGSSPTIAAGLAGGLCTRCLEDRTALRPVSAVAAQVGVARFAGLLRPATLGSRGCLAASAVLMQAHAGIDELRALLTELTPADAVLLLPGVPATMWPHLRHHLTQWLGSATADERDRLIDASLDRGGQVAIGAAVAAVVAAKGEQWNRRTLVRVGRAAVATGAAQPLYELYRAGHSSLEVRVLLLELLVDCPTLGPQVLKWRLAELVEHEAIRSRLAELRESRRDR